MAPNGLNETVDKTVEVALLEKRLVIWAKVFVIAKAMTLAFSVVLLINLYVYYVGDVPVEYYRMFAYPVALLGVFGVITVISVALHIVELKERLGASCKG